VVRLGAKTHLYCIVNSLYNYTTIQLYNYTTIQLYYSQLTIDYTSCVVPHLYSYTTIHLHSYTTTQLYNYNNYTQTPCLRVLP
jgi:hypothetical protein